MHRSAILLLVLSLAAARAEDAPRFVGESAALGRRFEELERKAEQARKTPSETAWNEVAEEIQAILSASGNELVPVGKEQVVRARILCDRLTLRLPSELLAAQRRRVEGQAKKWLDEGTKSRDVRLLERVVHEAGIGREAATATARLGDLAFERGDFDLALHWWRRLDDESERGARLLLARWFQGDRDGWHDALDAYKSRHGKAEGRLGGERGLYWKRLADIAAAEPFAAKTAPTLTPTSLARLQRDGQSFRLRFSEEPDRPQGEVKSPAEFARSMPLCPVVVGDHVVLADARFVAGIDGRTGRRETWFDAVTLIKFNAELRLPAVADLRYTLTAAENCVLARVGTQGLSREARESATAIVCLEAKPDARGDRVRWRALPDTEPRPAVFEGAPIVVGANAYVALTRFDADRETTTVHCYPLHSSGTALPRWKRDVVVHHEFTGGVVRHRHHRLSAGGPTLFYCTHAGAVVALDAATGQTLWGRRYRRVKTVEDETRPAAPRDLNPCIHVDGRVYVAPADSDLLLCLDAHDGGLIWERERIEIQHLLGVGKGRVLFTTRTPTAGLRAVGAADGSDRAGWFRTGVGAPVHSIGRGFLSGGLVVWPTLHHVYFLRQEDGEQPEDPTLAHRLPAGNLVFDEGIVAVGTRDEIHVFSPPRLTLPMRKNQAEQSPRSSLSQFRLGSGLADAGEPEAAVEAFRRASRLAAEGWVREAAIVEERRALFDAARQRSAKGEAEKAALHLAEASGAAFPPELRADGMTRAVSHWISAGDPARAAMACRSILADSDLSRARVIDAQGLPQTAAILARAMLERLAEDSEAMTALDRVLPAIDSAADLEKAAESSAVAPRVRDRLPELARTQERAGRLGAATRTLRLFLRLLPIDSEHDDARIAALIRSAELYERQGCRRAAREDLERLVKLAAVREVLGGKRLPREPGSRETLLSWALTHAERPALREPTLSLPLRRAWSMRPPMRGGILVPDGESISCLVVEGRTVTIHDAETGSRRRRTTLPLTARWAAQHLDTLLLGGDEGVCCVPFDGPASGEEAPHWVHLIEPGGRADGFRLIDGRLFFVESSRRLLALDATSGLVLWFRRAESSFLLRPDRPGRSATEFEVEGNVFRNDRRELLDVRSGKVLRTLPPHDDRRVAHVDPETGEEAWVAAISLPTTLSGEPTRRISLGTDAEFLLVSRNHGLTLDRIGRGGTSWSVLLSATPGTVSIGATACFVCGDGIASAYRLSDGKQLWTTRLAGPTGRWATRLEGGALLAWPMDRQRLAFTVPFSLRQLECVLSWDAEETIPMAVLDATDGSLMQRINVPSPAPRFGRGGNETKAVKARGGLLLCVGDEVVRLVGMESR